MPCTGRDLASADYGGGQFAGGDRVGRPGRQVPVEAGAGMPVLVTISATRAPDGAEVGGVVELRRLDGDRLADRRLLAVAGAGVAARLRQKN